LGDAGWQGSKWAQNGSILVNLPNFTPNQQGITISCRAFSDNPLSRTGFVTGLPSAKLNSTIIASLITIR